MTGSDVINRAYDMVGDVGASKRNAVADMVSYLNDGIRDLLARRPYLALNDDGTLDAAYTDLTTVNYAASSLPFDDEVLRSALAHYIAYRVFSLDAEDEANGGQAANHFAQYQRLA